MSDSGNNEVPNTSGLNSCPLAQPNINENAVKTVKEGVVRALKDINSTSRIRPEFDPVFRLFTVMYGTVVALILKPFVEGVHDKSFAGTFWDVVLLVLLIAFFVVDWVWSAAYLLNYWLKSPREHKFYTGFRRANLRVRATLLIVHFGLLCAFAMFAYSAWLFSWNYADTNLTQALVARPTFWWLCSVFLAIVWDSVMYYGPVDQHTTDLLDDMLKYVYIGAYVVTIGLLIWILYCESTLFSIELEHAKQISLGWKPPLCWTLTNAKHLVMGTLAFQILLRFITYFRVEKLVEIRNGTSETPAPVVAAGT